MKLDDQPIDCLSVCLSVKKRCGGESLAFSKPHIQRKTMWWVGCMNANRRWMLIGFLNQNGNFDFQFFSKENVGEFGGGLMVEHIS